MTVCYKQVLLYNKFPLLRPPTIITGLILRPHFFFILNSSFKVIGFGIKAYLILRTICYLAKKCFKAYRHICYLKAYCVSPEVGLISGALL